MLQLNIFELEVKSGLQGSVRLFRLALSGIEPRLEVEKEEAVRESLQVEVEDFLR